MSVIPSLPDPRRAIAMGRFMRVTGNGAATLLSLALLAGCAGTRTVEDAPVVLEDAAPGQPPDPAPLLGLEAVSRARSFLGTPYRYGGADPGGLDCSGLVYLVYRELGVSLPRTTGEQQQAVEPVAFEALAPGDLVFFRLPTPHVGIYAGDGEFLHAPGAGRVVEAADLTEPWFLLAFAGGGRIPVPGTPLTHP